MRLFTGSFNSASHSYVYTTASSGQSTTYTGAESGTDSDSATGTNGSITETATTNRVITSSSTTSGSGGTTVANASSSLAATTTYTPSSATETMAYNSSGHTHITYSNGSTSDSPAPDTWSYSYSGPTTNNPPDLSDVLDALNQLLDTIPDGSGPFSGGIDLSQVLTDAGATLSDAASATLDTLNDFNDLLDSIPGSSFLPGIGLYQMVRGTVEGIYSDFTTVYANADYLPWGTRLYVAVGTVIASQVGVRQVSDAFSDRDAVDGHLQSTTEQITDGVFGTFSLFLTALRIKGLLLPSAGLPLSPAAAEGPPQSLLENPNVIYHNAPNKTPSWSKGRRDYWKGRAGQAAEGEFSPANLDRVRTGKPPLHDELNVPKELHHKTPQRDGGLHTPDNLQEVWPWEHSDIDPFRHYNGPRPGG